MAEISASTPFMPAFQIGLVATILGVQFGIWFFSKYVFTSPMSPGSRIIGILYVLTVSMFVLVAACYKDFAREPPTPVEAMHTLKTELLSVAPLVLAAVVSLYLMATDRLTLVNLVLWPGLVVWLIMRRIYYRHAKSPRS